MTINDNARKRERRIDNVFHRVRHETGQRAAALNGWQARRAGDRGRKRPVRVAQLLARRSNRARSLVLMGLFGVRQITLLRAVNGLDPAGAPWDRCGCMMATESCDVNPPSSAADLRRVRRGNVCPMVFTQSSSSGLTARGATVRDNVALGLELADVPELRTP